MALYEFICENCGEIEERRQIFNTDPPTCCGKFMERKISLCNFSVGWTLSEKSFEVGQDMELIRNI